LFSGDNAVTGETKLELLEIAIANYNAMIRTLKRQMENGAMDSITTRQAIARYQGGRDVLDATLGLERIA
jgi:hypothetical protein